jgi:ribosomal protein S18 acetylase RimI-like enzyme
MQDFLAAERTRPALYMVHQPSPRREARALPLGGYEVTSVPSGELAAARPIVELDGSLTDAQWNDFTNSVLSDGLFVARDLATKQWVGTVSAVHNPHGSRFHFPNGGEIGYLVVETAHRGRGLGRSLVDAAISRFHSAGYRTIWLGVQGWRLPAIRVYLAAGFVFRHPPNPETLSERWRSVYEALGRLADSSTWLRSLPDHRP